MVVINWIMGHEVVLAGLVIALLDFLVEVIPSLKGNNLIGLLVNLLKTKSIDPPAV